MDFISNWWCSTSEISGSEDTNLAFYLIDYPIPWAIRSFAKYMTENCNNLEFSHALCYRRFVKSNWKSYSPHVMAMIIRACSWIQNLTSCSTQLPHLRSYARDTKCIKIRIQCLFLFDYLSVSLCNTCNYLLYFWGTNQYKS